MVAQAPGRGLNEGADRRFFVRGEALAQRHEAEFLARIPQDDLRIDLVRALESLPDTHREVILLRDMEQLTISEAAQRLGITRQATKSGLHRARALVRDYLRPESGHAER